MRFSTAISIATLGFVSGVLANPTRVINEPSLVKRDLASIESVVSGITAQVNQVDTDIKAGALNTVLSDSTALVSIINA
ncbi:hypothetical protein F66182_17740, partial [Fusarium sp. NRRL 66182]